MAPSNKRKRGSHVEDNYSSSSTLAAEDNSISSSELENDWEEEQDYERTRRTLYKKTAIKESSRLPIRTADGRIVRAPEPILEDIEEIEEEADGDQEDGGMEDADALVLQGDFSDGDEEGDGLGDAEPTKTEAERVTESKEELARLASTIIEDPEEHVGMLGRFEEIYEAHKDSRRIKNYVLGAQLAVYKDIIPGYRIRALTEEEKRAKVTKEIKRLRTFEHGLVTNYQIYVQKLASLAKARGNSQADLEGSNVAVACTCSLLDAVPHFNFRSELLKVIVDRLSLDRMDESSTKCLHVVETLFTNDESGVSSLEAVRMITKMIKAKNYHVHEYVLNAFLSLRLLSELDLKSIEEGESKRKMKKKDRQPWTKRQRKEEREKKVLAAQMKEADAVVHHEEREKNQNETLKLVFATYFHILQNPKSQLVGATLEGLAKFAHLINIDFFADILKALKEIIVDIDDEFEALEEGSNLQKTSTASSLSRRCLLCIVTSFALLFGQGNDAHKTMNLDLTFFIKHLYANIVNLSLSPDLEHSSRSLQLSNPDDDDSAANALPKPISKNVNADTEIEMLIRSLDFLFFKSVRSMGGISAVRLAAFTKRLYVTSLQMPEKSALTTLKLLEKLLKVHSKKLTHLVHSDDRIGDGLYNAYAEEAELSNPLAASVMWENALLEKHYSPKVAGAAKEAMKTWRKQ